SPSRVAFLGFSSLIFWSGSSEQFPCWIPASSHFLDVHFDPLLLDRLQRHYLETLNNKNDFVAGAELLKPRRSKRESVNTKASLPSGRNCATLNSGRYNLSLVVRSQLSRYCVLVRVSTHA